MSESILTTVKRGLGIVEEDTSFDQELLIHINGCFQPLRQLGVGPVTGFYVESDIETWEDYLTSQEILLSDVKRYIVMKTKLNFDPPEMGFVITSMERQLETMEGRFLIDTDKPPVSTEEVTTL
jgi:hypothetical protein